MDATVTALVGALVGGGAVSGVHALRQRRGHSRRDSALWDLAVASRAGLVELRADGTLLHAEPRLRELFGLTPGPTLQHLFGEAAAVVRTTFAGATSMTVLPVVVQLPTGHRLLRVTGVPRLQGERVTGWLATIVDDTADLALRERNQRYADILEATPDFICMTDDAGRFVYLNAAAKEQLQVSSEAEVAELTALDLYSPVSRAQLERDVLPQVQQQGVWIGELSLHLPNGREVPTSQVIVAHSSGEEIQYYSCIARDVTERKQAEAQLLHAGLYDSLTGLPNRVLFVDRLSLAVSRAEREGSGLAVLSLNVDRFKLVNDSYGHDVGDAVLARAADRLIEALRPGDTAARFTGDTFVVLCEDVLDDEHAVELAERLAAGLSSPFELDGERLFLSVSTGIATSREGATSPDSLLRDADAAMHRAKEKGGGRHELYSEHLHRAAVHRLRTANDLHRALGEGEFRLVYQPEVSLRDGHISGVEALLRWHHPDRGLVPPGEFIPLAEETGIIQSIGEWVIDEAAAQAAAWTHARHDGAALPVWVNLSPRQLSGQRVSDQVSRALSKYGLAPSQLGMEITETALLEDLDSVLAQLDALRALGVRLAVDDFGTGYASLAYLKRLPVDAVKIDRSFVDGLAEGGDDAAIVTAVIGMARALRLETIAEGVETRAQLSTLRRLGCDLAQGYYFTTPQPAATVSLLLEDDRRGSLFAFDDAGGGGGATLSLVTPVPRRADEVAG